MPPGALSSLVTNKIVPSLEQIPGVSYVEDNGDVTPSIQVNVNPNALRSTGLHADRHHDDDREQQRPRAGRHRLRAQSRDQHRHSRRRQTPPSRRGPAAWYGEHLRAPQRRAQRLSVDESARLYRIGDVANVHGRLTSRSASTRTRTASRASRSTSKRPATRAKYRPRTPSCTRCPRLRAAPTRRCTSTSSTSRRRIPRDQLSGVMRTLIEGDRLHRRS